MNNPIGNRRFLNVGGGSRSNPVPEHYAHWQHELLDIDPKWNPDILCDAKELDKLPGSTYDAIYCSHNLEHYYRHEVPKVLKGFFHLLKGDGFAEIRVPDIAAVMHCAVTNGLDIDDTLYHSDVGPIAIRDVIYGLGVEIERSGCDFYAHKTGYTRRSLHKLLLNTFPYVLTATKMFEVSALAFKESPTLYHQQLLNFSMPQN